MTTKTLYYVHDPMCSWCFGFSQTYKQLLKLLPADIEVVRLLGGLAPDSELAMPYDMQIQLQKTWHTIEDQIPGVKFNFDFWETQLPRRSTYPACRAVIAARNQGLENDTLMTAAIQRAYYLQARNPSEHNTLVEIATELGLSANMFEKDLLSAETQTTLVKEIALARQLFVESYPSLVLTHGQANDDIAIEYRDALAMLKQINRIILT